MIKIAIVGTGIIGLSHIKALKKIPDCKIAALCDLNEQVVKELAEDCACPYFLNYKDIPDSIDCDAVILNLPHGLHCEASIFFLERGIHVLVEKPMANTVEECEKMIEAEKKSGKKLAIAHIQRYFQTNRTIKELVDSGTLGKLCMTTECRSIDYFKDSRPRWFLSKKAAGGGILMNYGAHALDRLQYITGSTPKIAIGSAANLKNEYDIEGHAQGFVEFESGVASAITFSGYNTVAYEDIFYFTNGAIRTTGNNSLKYKVGEGDWINVEINPGADAIELEIIEFIKLIKGEEADIPDAEYGKSVIEAIEKIYGQL